jgi:PBP1b-binding outer membrane lipoprotein LpoB
MRKTKLILIAALACIVLSGCNNQPKTTIEKIDLLKKQVATDAKALQAIANEDFTTLQNDFHYCDSMLQYIDAEQVKANFDQLNLTQAYILQFKEVKPVMEKKMDYLVQQLDNLKSDAESQYLPDSLVLIYLDTETKVADTLHAQVDYFKDSFSSCQKSLNQMKKVNK